jgi:hypothetical protein
MPFALFFNGERISEDFRTRGEAQRDALLRGIEMEQICGAHPDTPPRPGDLDPGYEIREVTAETAGTPSEC